MQHARAILEECVNEKTWCAITMKDGDTLVFLPCAVSCLPDARDRMVWVSVGFSRDPSTEDELYVGVIIDQVAAIHRLDREVERGEEE